MNLKNIIVFILLGILFIAGVYSRWINPDEGAHLSDAQLLLQGKIPLVDYSSRQPFYVVVLAVFLKIFGMNLWGGRLTSLFFTFGNAILLYLIAKELFDRKTALITLLIYLLLPFTLLFSTIAKMENLVIFWALSGVYFFIRFEKKLNWIYIVLSGISFGLAYYIRESSFAVIIAVSFVVIIVGHKMKQRLLILTVLWGSYLMVAFVIILIYLKYFTFTEIFASSLNPFFQLQCAIKNLFLIFNSNIVDAGIIRIKGQHPQTTVTEFFCVFRYYIFLFIAFFFFIISYIKNNISKIRKKEVILPLLLLTIWAFSITSAYGYYAIARGFYPQYATEIFPPLIIGFACWIRFMQLSRIELLKEFNFVNIFNMITIVIIVSATCYGYASFGKNFDWGYDSVWSPKSLNKISKILKKEGNAHSEVLSGAMVWSFHCNMLPFADITHPIAFTSEPEDGCVQKAWNNLQKQPPEFIIMDGYTEKSYYAVLAQLDEFIKQNYTLIAQDDQSKYPILVYKKSIHSIIHSKRDATHFYYGDNSLFLN